MSSIFRSFPAAFGLASGHVWTVSSFVTRSFARPPLLAPQHVSIDVESNLGPAVSLSATLHEVIPQRGEPRPLMVLIHGLGGSADSGYMHDVTRVALSQNVSTLRVNLRGADEQGWDFYHAGLTDDVIRVLESPRLDGFDSIAVFGISLGGHVTLRAAADRRLPARVESVAALCPPLDLEASAAAFDAPSQWLYRRHVLRGLKAMYRRFLLHMGTTPHARDALSKLALPEWKEANAIQHIRDWDEKIVARRHGFASAKAYYHSQRASTRLHEVNVPSLIVTTRWDPMVPHTTTIGALAHATLLRSAAPWVKARVFPKLVHWELPSGGHVAWPEPPPPERSVIHHMLDWLIKPSDVDQA